MTDTTDLIERLEKATGHDPVLNAEIWMEMHPNWRTYPRTESGGWLTPDGKTRPAEDYTGSIDAALALFGEHIPRGLMLCRRSGPDMGGKNWIASAGSNRAAARSWPLAICILKLQDDRSRNPPERA